MEDRILTPHHLNSYLEHLNREEKSAATVEKYLRDAASFLAYTAGKAVTKEQTVGYKQYLQTSGYAIRSINSMLASLNSLLGFLGWTDCKVKALRCQRKTYTPEEKELSKAEYLRLLDASRHQQKLNLLLQTICSTGIRVSELKFFTVEAITHGEVTVRCKSKTRTILIPGNLKTKLLRYAKKNRIRNGCIFITKTGKPIDRSNIWAQMKRLCAAAGVNPAKVFPHNLRKLFARCFYALDKDIAKLADILGHSSVNTTRIYIMTTGLEHRRKIEQLGLVL